MDIAIYMKEFEVKFSRLKSNREQVPLEQLTTKYAKAYNALVKWLEDYAEWFTEEYCNCLALQKMPNDETGWTWVQKKIEAIKAEERNPGGLYQRIRDSLIEDLNGKEFEMNVWRLYDRLEKEAWDIRTSSGSTAGSESRTTAGFTIACSIPWRTAATGSTKTTTTSAWSTYPRSGRTRKEGKAMLKCKVESPVTKTVDGWLQRNNGPYGQNRIYYPHCHRHSGLHKPRPFCPWCGKQVTGNLDRYYNGYEPKGD